MRAAVLTYPSIARKEQEARIFLPQEVRNETLSIAREEIGETGGTRRAFAEPIWRQT
jgi:hypothetical protein